MSTSTFSAGAAIGQVVDGLHYLQVDAGVCALDLYQYSWNKTISHMLSTMSAYTLRQRATGSGWQTT